MDYNLIQKKKEFYKKRLREKIRTTGRVRFNLPDVVQVEFSEARVMDLYFYKGKADHGFSSPLPVSVMAWTLYDVDSIDFYLNLS